MRLIWSLIWVTFYFNADHLAGVYRSIDGNGLQFVMPVFNQETLLFYWPIVLLFFLLEVGLALYKWKVRKWSMRLASMNAAIHVLSAIFFIVIASNSEIFNEAFIPYMANMLEITPISIEYFMNWVLWISVATMIVTNTIDVYNGFRKAKSNN